MPTRLPNTPATYRPWLPLLGWLLISFTAAAIGGWASRDAAGFYSQLVQPVWAPAAWLFGPAWTVLYTLMAIAAWLVRQSDVSRERTRATWLFLLQLGANALWTWVFFAWRAGGWALVEIAILWLLIGATVASFWRIRPKAAWLLLPYWAWVSFAAALNFTLWRLNPALL